MQTSLDDFPLPERLKQIHGLLLLLLLLLATAGIAMLYSAAGGEWSPWAKAQSARLMGGICLMLILALSPIRWWFKAAYGLYVLGILMLLAVEISGHIGMGAQRWIVIGGVTIQPSEFMKLAVIVALARYFHSLHPMDRTRFVWMLPPALIIALPVALILKQPNLGTATIVTGICLAIWFAAGLQWRYVLGAVVLLASAAPLVWKYGLYDYQRERVMTFLNPEADPLGAGYNILQSMIAIGSGGFEGRGYMQGSQGQLDFLPEKHTDFIFTMVAEEFGFIGSAGLLGCFCLLFIIGTGIAMRSSHRFGSFIAIGVTTFLWLHVMINTAMVMGLIPVVGVPLPFLSYGGTMLLATCMAIGLLQNAYIHRDTPLPRVL